MPVIRRRGWELPEHHVTPENLFLDRRQFLAVTGAAAHAETVTQLSAPGNDRYFRISEPNVAQRESRASW